MTDWTPLGGIRVRPMSEVLAREQSRDDAQVKLGKRILSMIAVALVIGTGIGVGLGIWWAS